MLNKIKTLWHQLWCLHLVWKEIEVRKRPPYLFDDEIEYTCADCGKKSVRDFLDVPVSYILYL